MRNRAASTTTRVTLLLAVACLLGCQSPVKTSLRNRYSPLHPLEEFTITVVAENEEDLLTRLEISLYEYELALENGVLVASKRSDGLWGDVWIEELSSLGRVTRTIPVRRFPPDSLVRAIVRVRDGEGGLREEEWSFAAGAWTLGVRPIPLWQTGDPAHRIDLAFVADRESYTSARDMLPALEELLFDGFHGNNGVRRGREFWQFYYSPELGHIPPWNDAWSTQAVTPAQALPEIEIPDGVRFSGFVEHAAVVHANVKDDWWDGGGSFGTEPDQYGTACHEAGHAVFHLADEYAGGSHFWAVEPHHNIFPTQQQAQAVNNDAERIENSVWWRVEPTSRRCLMRIDPVDGRFASRCLQRIDWYYGELDP